MQKEDSLPRKSVWVSTMESREPSSKILNESQKIVNENPQSNSGLLDIYHSTEIHDNLWQYWNMAGDAIDRWQKGFLWRSLTRVFSHQLRNQGRYGGGLWPSPILFGVKRLASLTTTAEFERKSDCQPSNDANVRVALHLCSISNTSLSCMAPCTRPVVNWGEKARRTCMRSTAKCGNVKRKNCC